MVITYYGGQCFKISSGSTVIAFNPPGKKADSGVKFGADITLVTLWHQDFNGVERTFYNNKQSFVIDGPGEYEVGDVTVKGWSIPIKYKENDFYNTVYQVDLEGINIIFTGVINSIDNIDSSILSDFGDVDILFIPIGGGDVLEVPEAYRLAVKLESKLIIPMHYNQSSLSSFLKEAGVENMQSVDKYTIRKKELSEKSGEVVVFGNV